MGPLNNNVRFTDLRTNDENVNMSCSAVSEAWQCKSAFDDRKGQLESAIECLGPSKKYARKCLGPSEKLSSDIQ